ncbi:MAG: hypothetical protein MUE46_12260 [Xanthomonadales bacterium]|nr:hypothetical protein [Xanthomonadales bacterium]
MTALRVLLPLLLLLALWPASSCAQSNDSEAAPDGGFIDRVNWKEVLDAGTPVEIVNPHGDVRLRFGGYRRELELQAIAQRPKGVETRFELGLERLDDGVRLEARLPEGAEPAVGQRADLVLFVAEGFPVRIRTTRGQIEVRGLRGDLTARTDSGDVAVRGVVGLLDLESQSGSVEAAPQPAPAGSTQRIATLTGPITLGLAAESDLDLALATSAAFATEFSLEVTPQPGQEPNKTATARLGQGGATLRVESRRGEIRLLRRAPFVDVDPDAPPAAPAR